jgi:hypothetical protein
MKLTAKYSQKEKDIMIDGPNGFDKLLVSNVISQERHFHPALREAPLRSFLNELELRGYDLTTFSFSIKKKV